MRKQPCKHPGGAGNLLQPGERSTAEQGPHGDPRLQQGSFWCVLTGIVARGGPTLEQV